LAIGPREGVLLGAHFGRAIVTSEDCTAYVCDSASTDGAAVSGGACGVPRHCCIRWGPRCAGEGEVLGVFVPHFHSGKCHWVADVEMCPIPMGKLDNVSVRKTYVSLESSIRGLFSDIFSFKIKVGVYGKLAKRNDCSKETSTYAAKLPA